MDQQFHEFTQKNPREVLNYIHQNFGNLSLDSERFIELTCITPAGWIDGRYMGLNTHSGGQTLILEIGKESDRNIMFVEIFNLIGLQIKNMKGLLRSLESVQKENSQEPMSRLAADRLLNELSGYLKSDKQTNNFVMNFQWDKIEYTDSFAKKVKGLFEATYEVLNLVPTANFQKTLGGVLFLKHAAGSAFRLEKSPEIAIKGDFEKIELSHYKDQLNNILKDV